MSSHQVKGHLRFHYGIKGFRIKKKKKTIFFPLLQNQSFAGRQSESRKGLLEKEVRPRAHVHTERTAARSFLPLPRSTLPILPRAPGRPIPANPGGTNTLFKSGSFVKGGKSITAATSRERPQAGKSKIHLGRER